MEKQHRVHHISTMTLRESAVHITKTSGINHLENRNYQITLQLDVFNKSFRYDWLRTAPIHCIGELYIRLVPWPLPTASLGRRRGQANCR